MHSKLNLIMICLTLVIGCKTAEKKSQTFYDPEYRVIDRGALDVKLISQACSERLEEALSAAKNLGKYHLRSVVGNKNHLIKFNEIDRYIKNGKICVEISASSLPP